MNNYINLINSYDYSNANNEYKEYHIRKRNGKIRILQEPFENLKKMQYIIKENVLDKIKLDDNVYGFVKNKTIVDNAKMHLKSNYIMKFDLKDFFSNITKEQIIKALVNNKVDLITATNIANICTKDGVLPQGSPTSPVLSNIVFKPADRKIAKYCLEHNITYSRYADDLTFSSHDENAYQILQDLKPVLQSILDKRNFKINGNKIKTIGQHRQQNVTGIVINEKVNISKKSMKEYKSLMYNILLDIDNGYIISKEDILRRYHKSLESIKGYVNYTKSVNKLQFYELNNMLSKIEVLLKYAAK